MTIIFIVKTKLKNMSYQYPNIYKYLKLYIITHIYKFEIIKIFFF